MRPEPPEERRKRLSRLLSRKTRRGVTASRMRPKARHLSPCSCKPATATPQNRFAGRRIGPSRLSGAGGQFRFRLAYGDPLGGKAVKPGGITNRSRCALYVKNELHRENSATRGAGGSRRAATLGYVPAVHCASLHWARGIHDTNNRESKPDLGHFCAVSAERGSKRFPRLVQAVHNGNSRDRSPNNLQNWLHFSGDRRDEYASG